MTLFGVGFLANSKTETNEDFLVGGRSFNLWLSTFCLFATWFGAGTIISATDEISSTGISASLLEPYGSGFCLIIAGFLLAKKLWEMQLLTYSDFFKIKFGTKVEGVSVFTTLPTFIGWIAVQYLAVSEIIATFTPLTHIQALLIIVLLTTLLTMMGGMWSVSLTDSVQMFIIIIGLVYLFFKIFFELDLGAFEMYEMLPIEKKSLNIDNFQKALGLLSAFSIAALGNLTGQDLGQRIFSAKSAKVARNACLIAGVLYLLIGSIPVWFGMTSELTIGPEYEGNLISLLIKKYLDPVTSIVLLLAITSAVVSTITSALLAPSSVLANNFLNRVFPNVSELKLCRISVVLVAITSLIVALMGENVYSLLEDSYAIGFVGFFPALLIGLYSKKLSEIPMLITIFVASTIWICSFFVEFQYSSELIAVAVSFPVYYGLYFFFGNKNKEVA
tara:strand:+ start:25253 stop:26590 length:1338 start_codon:yes stop_codon:yes gene_type:complete